MLDMVAVSEVRIAQGHQDLHEDLPDNVLSDEIGLVLAILYEVCKIPVFAVLHFEI